MLNSISVLVVFKTFSLCTFNASKVTFIHFYLHGRLHSVSVRKPSEWMSNFWMVRFLKTESELYIGFPHITTCSFLGGKI